MRNCLSDDVCLHSAASAGSLSSRISGVPLYMFPVNLNKRHITRAKQDSMCRYLVLIYSGKMIAEFHTSWFHTTRFHTDQHTSKYLFRTALVCSHHPEYILAETALVYRTRKVSQVGKWLSLLHEGKQTLSPRHQNRLTTILHNKTRDMLM